MRLTYFHRGLCTSRPRPVAKKIHFIVCSLIGGLFCWIFYLTGVRPMLDLMSSYQRNQNHTLSDAFLARAGSDRIIVLAVLDTSFASMAYNLYESSFLMFDINNYLFIGMDETACEQLHSYHQHRSEPIACITATRFNESDGKRQSEYGSESFLRKSRHKLAIVLDALHMSLDVLLVDLDIIFLRNPLPVLLQGSQYDLQMMPNGNTDEVNTGFYFVRSTDATKRLLREAIVFGEQMKLDDQGAVNLLLQPTPETNNQSIRFQYLDANTFSSGINYYAKYSIVFKDDVLKCRDCVVVHNNWITGFEVKIYRFKETGMWYVDSGESIANDGGDKSVGYYTDQTRLYLSYENPHDFGPKETVKRETNALMAALYMGHLLNRTVILPSFHCYRCLRNTNIHPLCKKYNRCFYAPNLCLQWINDTMSASDSGDIHMLNAANRCSLQAHFNVSHFDLTFAGAYRESVFLQHPKVPDTIKQRKSPLMWIAASREKLPRDILRQLGPGNIFSPANAASGASRTEIQSWFSGYRGVSVLRFHSLYNVVPDRRLARGADVEEDDDFFRRLRAALPTPR